MPDQSDMRPNEAPISIASALGVSPGAALRSAPSHDPAGRPDGLRSRLAACARLLIIGLVTWSVLSAAEYIGYRRGFRHGAIGAAQLIDAKFEAACFAEPSDRNACVAFVKFHDQWAGR